jgi:hypothetical protein
MPVCGELGMGVVLRRPVLGNHRCSSTVAETFFIGLLNFELDLLLVNNLYEAFWRRT